MLSVSGSSLFTEKLHYYNLYGLLSIYIDIFLIYVSNVKSGSDLQSTLLRSYSLNCTLM